MRPKEERIREMRVRASEMARSGTYFSWVEIEKALIGLGYVEARIEFTKSETRTGLDEVCRIAQGARARGITYEEALKEERGRR